MNPLSPQALAYFSLAFVFAFTPGATTAVVIRHTLDGGRRRGLTASLGAITASVTLASLALGGVSTLLVRWPAGLKWLGIAGALFLAWMGIKSLRAAMSVPATTRVKSVAGPHVAPRPYREGFAINILNPSVLSFYVGVTPTFLPPGSTWRGLVFLYSGHILIVLGCHTFWALLFNQARTLFAGERARRGLDVTVGLLLLWLAARIFGKM